MKTIYKYQLKIDDIAEIEMPSNAEILTVQIDKKTDLPHLWAMVYVGNPKEKRTFEIFGTGNTIPDGVGVERIYIGTFQFHEGQFVGHVFERIN